jgi:glycosyltransferase involved in cell wall biosynthesis
MFDYIYGIIEPMSPALSVFAAIAGLELLIWLPPLWRFRTKLAALWIALVAVSAAWLFITSPTFLVGLLLCIVAYRLVNLGRVVSGRMRTEYLRGVSWRTAWLLAAFEVMTVFAWWLFHDFSINQGVFWDIVLFVQLAIAGLLMVTTLHHLRTTRPPKLLAPIPTSELPTLTVAIPARNETEDLQKCLASLIASDYPKLEIIVLDDCSQNSRTPEIIRSFAHDGVRFIAGDDVKDGWLSKNQAYQRLSDEANGDYILFCGVDARFESQSLRQLMQTMLQKKKNMISVIPKNEHPSFVHPLALLVQPMRYAWEIALPRKIFKRPPVLSTCWIIQRKLLESAGGFKGVSRSILPESYFARVAVVHDGYSFMQSNDDIGITCDKIISEQHDTATRTKYPQLHRRPELVFLLSLGELLALILPIVFLTASLAAPELRLLALVSGITSAVLVVWYVVIVALVFRRFVLLSLLALPFAVIHDVAVLNYSMLKYEFSTVLWKGRNVCIPVMRVEKRLPDLN